MPHPLLVAFGIELQYRNHATSLPAISQVRCHTYMYVNFHIRANPQMTSALTEGEKRLNTVYWRFSGFCITFISPECKIWMVLHLVSASSSDTPGKCGPSGSGRRSCSASRGSARSPPRSARAGRAQPRCSARRQPSAPPRPLWVTIHMRRPLVCLHCLTSSPLVQSCD